MFLLFCNKTGIYFRVFFPVFAHTQLIPRSCSCYKRKQPFCKKPTD